MNMAGWAALVMLLGVFLAPVAGQAQGLSIEDLNAITSDIGQPDKVASQPQPSDLPPPILDQQAPGVVPFPMPSASGNQAPPVLSSASETLPSSGPDSAATFEPPVTGQSTIRPPLPVVRNPPPTRQQPVSSVTPVGEAPKPLTPPKVEKKEPQTFDPMAAAMRSGVSLTPQQVETISGQADSEMQPVRITTMPGQTGVSIPQMGGPAEAVKAPEPSAPQQSLQQSAVEPPPIATPQPRQPVMVGRKAAKQDGKKAVTGNAMVSPNDQKRAIAARPVAEPVDSDDAKDGAKGGAHRRRKASAMNCSPPDLRLETYGRRAAVDMYRLRGVLKVPTEGYTYRSEPAAQRSSFIAPEGGPALMSMTLAMKRPGDGYHRANGTVKIDEQVTVAPATKRLDVVVNNVLGRRATVYYCRIPGSLD
jgi:hypothetical protein